MPGKGTEPNTHPSGLTGSRCLANVASYWLVFMFLCTFLFTSSTCLPCCGCLRAPCLHSWAREQRLGLWSLKTRVPSVSFIGPGSRELETAGNRSPRHVGLNKNLVEATEGLLGLDILSNSSLNSCCGYKSASLVWEALSTALAPGP